MKNKHVRVGICVLLSISITGCLNKSATVSSLSSNPLITPPVVKPPAYSGPTDENVLDGIADLDFCAQGDSDKVSLTFCVDSPPPVASLADLRNALGLGFVNRNGRNGQGGNPAFTLTGHSSSLVERYVSAINPRAIVFTPGVKDATTPYIVMGYTRGEQFAEIAATDAITGELNFYLIQFQRACNETGTCKPGDLLTPAIEKNWTKVKFFESDTFKNTFMDCMQCHQRGGILTDPILRMQENTAPYTHFMWSQSTGGKALLADFHAAHGTNEDYAGIPARMIDQSDPSLMADFVASAGFDVQPNAFPSALIEAEVKASSPNQPANNLVAGTSATWNGIFDQFIQGLAIPPPFHDVKVTDPVKLAAMTKAYSDVRRGLAPASGLPDIRDVFPDSTLVLSELGIRVRPGLDGKGILKNACMQCHNSTLDQTISRANFNVEVIDTLSRYEKNAAIARILQPQESLRLMPPRRFRTLTDQEKNLAIQYLSQ